MSDFKPIVLDAVLALSEADIKATFPNGARVQSKEGKPDRYSPADSKPDKSLSWLLREKAKRQEIERIPHKDSTRGYTTDPAMGMRPDVGTSPSEAVLDEYAEDNWRRFMEGLEAIDSRHPSLYVKRRIAKKVARSNGSVRKAA